MQVIELQVLAACAQFQRELAGERQRAVHDRQIDRDFTLVIARDRVGDAGNGLVDGGAVDQQVGLGQGLFNSEVGHQTVLPRFSSKRLRVSP
ncbi:hypothetical protein D9M71_760860 [compost metagenome]